MQKVVTKIISVFLHVAVWVITYILIGYIILWIRVYTSEKMIGAYNPVINIYMCELELEARSNCIYHEQGHAYDYHNTPMSFLWKEQRSAGYQFRVDIDAINTCLTTIFDNYDILHTEYPKTSQSLITIKHYTEHSEYYSDGNEDRNYEEIYAELYAIMKTYRWDQYHYDDVEDMAAQKAIDCQRFFDENAETLRPRQN